MQSTDKYLTVKDLIIFVINKYCNINSFCFMPDNASVSQPLIFCICPSYLCWIVSARNGYNISLCLADVVFVMLIFQIFHRNVQSD